MIIEKLGSVIEKSLNIVFSGEEKFNKNKSYKLILV
jgi:hypothetical protein